MLRLSHHPLCRTTGAEMMKINLLNPKCPRRASNCLNSESGMATIETISLLIIFMIMISYTFGAFGIIHTGILNSIAARTYAFETMRNRSNVIYFRDTTGAEIKQFQTIGSRLHTIRSEANISDATTFIPTERAMQMGLGGTADVNRDPTIHTEKIPSIVDGKRNSVIEVNPVWVMTQYGICVSAKCGN